MSMRKLISAFLISIFSFLLLVVLFSNPSAAQELGTPAPKGPEPTPAAPTPTPESSLPQPPFQIDSTLLPKIEPQLLKKLLESNNKPTSFIVYLKTQTDIAAVASAASNINAQAKPDLLARRTAIVNTLQQTARNTQAGVLQLLNGLPSGGGVSGQNVVATNIKPLWIVNAVAAKGSLDTVLALAARPDVQIIRLDKEITLNRPSLVKIQNLKSQIQNPEWGISKIRADLVHNALAITGTGIVVANIDTGVDWQHPALQTNYRGYMGGGQPPVHTGNFSDTTTGGSVVAIDDHGHGTHTMGTAVGHGGIGVAPGAKWIAVKALNSSGSGQFSWLHAAFQWLLAPNGDPNLAPHIVNNSWGSNNGASTEFQADVQALLNAGIYPVFAAGNNGAGSGTVGSPGSYDNAFAVGATTIDDEITNFSSRGPSPWGKIKPDVSAPGKNVRSALPGGAYGNFNGTSMAAPHVSGLAALLLQASPTLTGNLNNISTVIKSTAVQLGNPIPNNNFGWGRIDAYNAVMSVVSAGTLQGVVTDVNTSAFINTPFIQITPTNTISGPTINITGDINGAYTLGLASTTYTVTASAFGYQPKTVSLIGITTNTTTIQNFSLTPYPTGFLTGTVKDKNTGNPLAATITINGTPAGTTSNPTDGSYSLKLPIGTYTVTVVAAQHRVTQVMNINISAGVTITQNFLLDTAPSILIVDSGKWYQESQISYYQQALDDALYPYDTWQITNSAGTPTNIPSVATLSSYDIVIWSSPEDSPGYIGADDEIAAFLNGGGRLLLSGQNIAFYDAYWFYNISPYLTNQLYVKYDSTKKGTTTVNGLANEPFAGLSLSITGGDGANNQGTQDVIINTNTNFARSLLSYSNNNLAGVHVSLCVPYRAMFFAFGFEGINSRSDRSQVIEQAIDWLIQTPHQTGVELTPPQETLVGNFGTTVSHTINLRNIGTTTDVYTLTLNNIGPYNWSTSAAPAPIPLATCQSQNITLTVQIPPTKTWHISDTFTLSAQSTNNPTITNIATRSTKTPASVLLVDDDRWYSFAVQMKAGLETNNIPYDYWHVPDSWSGPVPPSPPLKTLQMYPMIVWYTAYDWFQPLLPTEEDRLIDYLKGGGRLLFSSQDFLAVHLLKHGGSYDTFAQDYLGVQAHTEDYFSTLTLGDMGNPAGAYLGPYNLTFPAYYRNWTDALTPTITATILTRGQENQPNGLTNAGIGPGGDHWHTTFLAYGPELIPLSNRTRFMQRMMGWLSWLGSSTIEPQVTTVAPGSLITYTATISNNGAAAIATAYFTATFPAYLTPHTASPGVNLVGGEFLWRDSLAQNQNKTFTYTAQINGVPLVGSVISQTSWLAYDEHNILFDRVADLRSELNTSLMVVTPTQQAEYSDIITYTIVLNNNGDINDPMVTITNTLPSILNPMGINPPGSGTVINNGRSFTWTTALTQGYMATLTFRAAVSTFSGGVIENVAYVNSNNHQTVTLPATTTLAVPIFNTSSMVVTPTQHIDPNDILTYTIVLRNSGTADDPMVTTTNPLPQELRLAGVYSPSNGLVISHSTGITWMTPLGQDQVATLTFRTVASADSHGTFENIAHAQGTYNVSTSLIVQAAYTPIPYYFPIIFKKY